jgi:hypothetical protein
MEVRGFVDNRVCDDLSTTKETAYGAWLGAHCGETLKIWDLKPCAMLIT